MTISSEYNSIFMSSVIIIELTNPLYIVAFNQSILNDSWLQKFEISLSNDFVNSEFIQFANLSNLSSYLPLNFVKVSNRITYTTLNNNFNNIKNTNLFNVQANGYVTFKENTIYYIRLLYISENNNYFIMSPTESTTFVS